MADLMASSPTHCEREPTGPQRHTNRGLTGLDSYDVPGRGVRSVSAQALEGDAMEWLLLLLVAGGGGLAARRVLGRRSQHREEVEELDGIRQLARRGRHVPRRAAPASRRAGPGAPARPGRPGRLPGGARRVRGRAARGPADPQGRGRQHGHRHPVGRAVRAGVRPGPGGRRAAPGGPRAVLLQPAARAVRGQRDVDPARSRHPERPRVRAGRRPGRRPRGARHPQGPDGVPQGPVLGRGRRVPAVRRGVLRRLRGDDVGVPAAGSPGVAAAPPARSTAAASAAATTAAAVTTAAAAGTAAAATTAAAAGTAAGVAATRRFASG